MQHKRPLFLLSMGSFLFLLGMTLWILVPQPVEAQCGSQASSCKNCHEVQGQDPVNKDGTGWHESHAFGDFCIMCHAGNEQATDKDAAHIGMVPPLSDVKAACQMCHTDDLDARAQVYAIALGVDLSGGGGSSTTSNQPEPTTAPTSVGTPAVEQATISAPVPAAAAAVSVPVSNEVVVNDPNVVDYVQRYNEIVLGERPTNWGNIALIVLIAATVLGGGGFILLNEVRLRVAAGETKRAAGEYPAEVVDMLPALAGLKTQSLKTLRNILNHPKKTDKVLDVVEKLVADDNTPE